MSKLLFIFLMSAAPVSAQMFIGADMGPDHLMKDEEAKINQQDEDLFAKAFVLENSTAALNAVFESTAPARAAASYMRQGVYRQELLMLYAIARDSKTTFKALYKEHDKGVSLKELAAKNKADLMKIFKETEELQKKIEIRTAFIDVSTAVFKVESSSVPSSVGVSTLAVPSIPDEKK